MVANHLQVLPPRLWPQGSNEVGVQADAGGWHLLHIQDPVEPHSTYGHHHNLITTVDCNLLPTVADCSAPLDGCQVFSKLNLQKGYLQVPVAPEDVTNTAVITPF
jgi:hypothetical protein